MLTTIPTDAAPPGEGALRPGWAGRQLALALAVVAIAGACGPSEPERAGAADSEVASAPRRPRAAGKGAKRPGRSPSEPTDAAAFEVDRRALPPLFSGRIPPATDAVAAHMQRFETDEQYWPTETAAERCEARLAEFVRAILAGDVPDGIEVTAPLGPGVTVFDQGGLRVWRRERAPLADGGAVEPTAFGELVDGLRTDLGQRTPELELLVTSIQGASDSVTGGRLVLALRDEPPLQVALDFEARWRGGPLDPVLAELAITDLEQVSAPARLFAEITPWLLEGTDFYAGELLRGVDDYFMRTDRQGGTAFQGMQGVSVGDVNGDGLEDLFVCSQVGLPNRLLIKQPDGSVVERASEARVRFLDVTRTALIVDLDGDGHSDLALAVGPNLVVAYNDGLGVFEEQLSLSTPGPEQIYALSAADPDLDGDLDLYAGRYALEGVMHGVPTPYHDASNGSTNTFWRNEGRGRFVDATAEVGLAANNTQFTLATVWDDFDGDGAPDLYVVNDFGRNNLFRNDGSGHFEDLAERVGALDVGAGMGASVADYDLDGDPDIYVTNMFSAPGMRITQQSGRFMDGQHPEVLRWYQKHARGNSLLRNRGDGTFEDVTDAARVAPARWAWGGLFCDFGNDGLEDLVVPCGHATRRGTSRDLDAYFWHRVISSSPPDMRSDDDYASAFGAVHRMVMYGDYSWNGSERNLAWLNTGGARFADVSGVSGLDWPDDARSAALTDWDEDGRLDIVLKSRNAPRLRVLHNRAAEAGHWLAFELEGTRANRDAVGALVEVQVERAGGTAVLSRRVRAGEGYLAQSSLRPQLGLGAAESARVSVRWPGGAREDFGALAADRRWRLVEGSGRAEAVAPRMDGAPERLAALPHREGQWNPDPVGRVPLAARLPLAPFPAPGFDAPGRRLADLAGTPALVLLFTSADEGGAAALGALGTRASELARSGLSIVPLSVDEGPALGSARALAAEHGFGSTAGYADGRARRAYEMVFLEVLGYFDVVPAPSALLLDPTGALVVLYLGPPRPEELFSDLAAMASYPPGSPGTGRFGGGRWQTRRGRDLAGLAAIFEAQGYAEIARYYAELAR